jgi:hypothetical protein
MASSSSGPLPGRVRIPRVFQLADEVAEEVGRFSESIAFNILDKEGNENMPGTKKEQAKISLATFGLSRVPILIRLVASLGILTSAIWTPARAQKPGPNEIIVYEDIDYLGTQSSWKLEPGMRQKLVPYVGADLNDRISSLRVGSDVGVAVFDDASYGGVYVLFEDTSSAHKVPTGDYFDAINDRISSLIIYPKKMKGPLGVLLGGPIVRFLSFTPPDTRFFPLPEMMNQASAKFPMLGPEWDDLFDYGMIMPAPNSPDYGGYVEVVLYEQANFGGKSVTIPWRAPAGSIFPLPPVGEEGIFELADLDFVAIASSLELHWVNTSSAHATAPPASNAKKTLPDKTQAPPGLQTAKAPLDKKLLPPSSGVTDAGISGQWNSNIGVVYEIQQSGNNFTWSVPSLNQSGTGTVSGNIVTMSGPGWTVKGTITETDASGRPTKIVGENNVILFRAAGGQTVPAPSPAQQPIPPTLPAPPAAKVTVTGISGQWNSNIGAVYEIQQSGNTFTWSAPSLNQSGTGTVSGNIVTMSGPGWTVKGIITEADSSGRPTKIVGENGVVLFRTPGGASCFPE